MLRPCKFALLLAAIVHAYPTGSYHTTEIVRRQQFDGPKTVNTEDTFQTPVGLVTQKCSVTLTPVRGRVVGQDLVREEKKCTITVASAGNANISTAAPPPPPATPPPPPSSAGITTSSAGVTNSVSSITSSSAIISAPPASSTLSISSAVSPPPPIASTSSVSVAPPPPPVSSSAVSVNPVTSVSIAPPPVTPPPPSTSTAATPPAPPPASISASAIPATGVSAAAEQASSGAPFQIPGKKLEVLPIGLGVFAGISVIALIVVGLVTYERTKYRRAFRQRKLAESAQPMGYGGMAERA